MHTQRWEELAESARFNARELARLCHISDRQLQRQFRCHLDQSPRDWLNERRLEVARRLLLSGSPIKTITFELGFKHVSHFCRQFKSRYQMTPTEFIFSSVAPSESRVGTVDVARC
jgi:AraC-like DNA-binding protein